jgi:hypothetical protein
VSLSEAGDALGLTAKPAEVEFAAKFPNADGGKPVPTLSAARPLPPLYSGNHAEIGLFELEGQGLRVIDTVETKLDSSAETASASSGRLRLAALKLRINGTPVQGGDSHGAVSGRYAMIYVPGRGAFILSAEPVTGRGFVKAGSIDGNKLNFVWNNDSYEADANAPILGSAETGELWVYLDASYQPSGNWTKTRSPDDHRPASEEFFTAASDSPSWWLP